jgi:hypothetical protein
MLNTVWRNFCLIRFLCSENLFTIPLESSVSWFPWRFDRKEDIVDISTGDNSRGIAKSEEACSSLFGWAFVWDELKILINKGIDSLWRKP